MPPLRLVPSTEVIKPELKLLLKKTQRTPKVAIQPLLKSQSLKEKPQRLMVLLLRRSQLNE